MSNAFKPRPIGDTTPMLSTVSDVSIISQPVHLMLSFHKIGGFSFVTIQVYVQSSIDAGGDAIDMASKPASLSDYHGPSSYSRTPHGLFMDFTRSRKLHD